MPFLSSFSLPRYRAARVDDFVETLRDLHKQFHWPLPHYSQSATPSSVFREDNAMVVKYSQGLQATPPQDHDETEESLSSSPSGLKRSNRPPDLNLDQSQVEEVRREEEVGVVPVSEDQEVMLASSTPTKMSTTGSCSALSHSTLRAHSCEYSVSQPCYNMSVCVCV